jgi:hypothetical protein
VRAPKGSRGGVSLLARNLLCVSHGKVQRQRCETYNERQRFTRFHKNTQSFAAMASSRRHARRICNLHDCLSLGEVELGLTVSAPTTPAATSIGAVGQLEAPVLQHQDHTVNSRPPDPEEIRHRLPLLLRLLQDSRPLSSIPDVMLAVRDNKVPSSADQKQAQGIGEAEPTTEGDAATSEKTAKEPSDGVVTSAPASRKKGDVVVQGAVDRLEDSVAMDPTAEDVERVACRLAPLACRRMLRHHRARGGGGGRRNFDLELDSQTSKTCVLNESQAFPQATGCRG